MSDLQTNINIGFNDLKIKPSDTDIGLFREVPTSEWQDHMVDVPIDESPLTRDSIYWQGIVKGYKIGIVHCGMPELFLSEHAAKLSDSEFLKKKFSILGWFPVNNLMKPMGLSVVFNTTLLGQGFDYDATPIEAIKSKIAGLSDDALPPASSPNQVLLFFLTRYDIAGSCNGGKINNAGVLMMVDTGSDIDKIQALFDRFDRELAFFKLTNLPNLSSCQIK